VEANSGCLIASKEGVSEGMRLDLWRHFRARRRGGGFLELKPQAEWVVPLRLRGTEPRSSTENSRIKAEDHEEPYFLNVIYRLLKTCTEFGVPVIAGFDQLARSRALSTQNTIPSIVRNSLIERASWAVPPATAIWRNWAPEPGGQVGTGQISQGCAIFRYRFILCCVQSAPRP
jgi:hypothetical protein